jgi:hypothetical protein
MMRKYTLFSRQLFNSLTSGSIFRTLADLIAIIGIDLIDYANQSFLPFNVIHSRPLVGTHA